MQLAKSPMRAQIDTAFQLLRAVAPGPVQSVLPIVEQLEPIFMDVANGRQEFTPSPKESDKLLRTYYNVSNNLLIRFEDDQIDETPRLIQMLQNEAAISAAANVTIRTLPGDHVRPLAQNIGDLPPELASFATNAAKSGGTVLGALVHSRYHVFAEPATNHRCRLIALTKRHRSTCLVSWVFVGLPVALLTPRACRQSVEHGISIRLLSRGGPLAGSEQAGRQHVGYSRRFAGQIHDRKRSRPCR